MSVDMGLEGMSRIDLFELLHVTEIEMEIAENGGDMETHAMLDIKRFEIEEVLKIN